MIGKKIRMERLFNRDTGRTIIVPLDHGLTMGPIEGLKDMKTTVKNIKDGLVNAVVMHKGYVEEGYNAGGPDTGLIVHLSGSTSLSPHSNLKVMVCTVEEAIKLGADGVSIQVNLGSEHESKMLNDFGKIGKICSDWGMPLLAMVYTRGPAIENENDVDVVKMAARVANELGADMVKVAFTGNKESFQEVIDGCSIPVLIAGGEKAKTTKDVLNNIKMALDAGGKGVSMGRNVFQHSSPANFCRAVGALVHKNVSIEEALKMIGE